MRTLLSKLWADDKGAVISAELVLVLTLVVVGLIPGLIALRNTENASLATIGNELLSLQTGFSFATFSIVGTDGTTIATVNGGQYNPTGTQTLISASTPTGIVFTSVPVSPAP